MSGKLLVSVESFTPRRSNTLIGFVDILVPQMRLRVKEASIHQSHDRRWVGLPAKPQIDQDGRVRLDEKVNAPRPEWTSDFGAGIKLTWIATIVGLFIYGVGSGQAEPFVGAVLIFFAGATLAWVAASGKENEFKQRAAAEAHDEAWEIVNSKLAKEDTVRNAMFDAAVSRVAL